MCRYEQAGLRVAPELREEIEYQAAACSPYECCGALLGTWVCPGVAAGQAVLSGLIAVENTATGDRRVQFSIHPQALLDTRLRARTQGLTVVGYYHSHPQSPAVPSAEDRRAAWPGWIYLIAGVGSEQARELRSWRFTDDREAVEIDMITQSSAIPNRRLA